MRFLIPLALLVAVGIVSANDSNQTKVFQDSWSESPQRPWPGAEWHANRAQDWQVQGDWLQCLTGESHVAGRTVHLLTQRIEDGTEAVDLSVTVMSTTLGKMRDGACFGLLIGMGDEQTDYRATALVQQAPAAGGGMLVSLDSDGKLSLRDFSTPLKKGGYWTIPGNVDFRKLPEIAAATKTFPVGTFPVRLRIQWKSDQLTIRATAQVTGKNGPDTVLEVSDFGREKLRGGISLFSARGAEESKTGFSFADFRLAGGTSYPERSWGPVLGVLYTLATDRSGEHALRMTVQHPALAENESPKIELVVKNRKPILGTFQSDGSFTTRLEAPFPHLKKSIPFVLMLDGKEVYEGILRREPHGEQEPLVGVLSCVKNQVGPLSWNPDGLWFPHNEIADSVQAQDPDLLYFAGDQIYEGDITGVDRRTPWHSIMDYHTKWRRFLWSFGELTRTRPTICVPDDHDVFHGNLWGAGGKLAKKQPGMSAQDAGGYKMPATFVNAVHSTLVAHLPPTQVSPTIGQGISTYTTSFSWGGLDFCVLADRMWKDSPASIVPDLNFKNGWPQADEFEPKDSDVAGAQLLGAEQEAFLAEWAERKTPNTWTKVVLSQSPFACMHTLPGRQKSDNIIPGLKVPLAGDYPENDQPVVDADSNGWPQTPRDRAVKSLARAGALHLTGDQHLGSVAWYGVDEFRDGSVVFSSPAMGNTFPRRWMPKEAGINPEAGAPRYTGDYLDGFGNKVTILAIANPADEGRKPELLYNRAPGYGLVRFHPQRKMATLEAWPRWSNPNDPSQMFPGWPVTVRANGTPAKNTLQLPAVITDGMVLQRESKVKIWGWADAGTLVSVSGSWGVSENASANTEGRWEVFLETGVAGGPHQLKISTAVEEKLLEDILFGEVWLCGGQSNMEWTLGPKVGQGIDNWQTEVATAEFPQIRFFDVPHRASVGVGKIGAGSWSACSPETATTFSAVGYLFGRRLHKELNVPIGLISCNWGGTVAETWMSPSGVASHGGFDSDLNRLSEMTPADAWGLQALQDRWWKKLDNANAVMPITRGVVALPSKWSGDLNGFDGVVWYQRQVSIPESWDGKPLTLELGPIDDNDTTWFNDFAVGKSHADGLWQNPRKYPVPAGQVHAGGNSVRVRAVDTGGEAGFTGSPEQMRLVLNETGESISLAGDWEWVKGTSLGEIGSFPRQNWPNQNVATVLYNGMLSPLVGYGMKGAIWYQGESNMTRAEQYRTLFPALIEDWREVWNIGDFPFYFVQIAPFKYGLGAISSGALRDAQRTSLRIKNTGMAVTLDIGNPANIHPTNKQDVADRLARWALSNNYGKDVGAISGPLFRDAERAQWKGQAAMKVSFDHADVLKTRDGKSPSHLEIQTAKEKWVPAQGEIHENTLWVYSENSSDPTAVRFAWGDIDEPNLVNGDGLPASTFLSPPISIPLFNGEDLTGWAPVNCDSSTWTAKDGMIVCSGKPTGLLRTTRMYENFEMELEWRHLVPGGNAGLFVWSDPVPAVGGPFARAVEVQVMDGPSANWYTTHGDIFPIWGAKMKPMHPNPLGGSRCFPSEHRSNPSPKWNHYKVTCKNGSIRLEVNGKEVSGGDDISPRVGYIVLESEGTEAHFRNLKIRELPAAKIRPTRREKVLPATGMTPLYGGLNLDAWETPSGKSKNWKSKDWRIWTDGKGLSLGTKVSHPASLVSFHLKWKTMPQSGDSTSIQWGKQKIDLAPSAANKWQPFFTSLAAYQSLEETLAPISFHHSGGELEIANVLFRPIPNHSAVQPEPRPDEWWQKRHLAMNTAAQNAPADLLFIGDSITQAWEGPGAPVWKRFYSKRRALNLGISGDRTQHVLWRLRNGNLGNTQPKLAVMMIGTNNSGANTGIEIADGIREICAELRRQRPEMEILVLGIFPRGPDREDPRRLVTEEANQWVESWASTQEKVQFLDIGEKFLTETGQLPKKVMPDLLHLNPSSYEVWAKATETAIGKILPR